MSDITLPLKGGWILINRVPNTVIKPEFLGIYYAKPEKVFERGSFEIGGFGNRSGLTETEMHLLYKRRAGAKMSAANNDALRLAHNRLNGFSKRKRGNSWAVEAAPSFEFLEEDAPEVSEDIEEDILSEIDLEMRVRILTPQGEVCIEPYEYSILKDIEPYIECIGQEYQMRELGGFDKAKKLKEQLFYVMSRAIPKIEAYKMLLGQIDRPNVFWLEPHPEVQAYFGRAA